MMLGEPCTLYFLLLFTILSEIISSNITCFGFSLIEDLVILHVHILKFIFSKLTYVNVIPLLLVVIVICKNESHVYM